MYFANGAKYSFMLSVVTIGVAGLLTVSYLTPYRWQRIVTYFKPSENYETSGYHINQALIAIGNGGLTGVGLGQSTTKIKYLPEPIGDSIFAIVSEELGFVGSVAVILIIWLLVARILVLSRKVPHKFGQLLLVGFGCLIGLQAFVNIGAISGLIPLTGMSLPFISYGGTGLTTYMTIAGIIANISKYAR
jgi:cell division protein FtsW